ncbi:hypothetical protein PMAYCL1PPCAC_14881, partial [Pristionchus mayeri]
FASWSIAWGVMCEILYMPCAVALYRERAKSCYRVMLWLAFVDCVALMLNSIIFGIIIICGLVFCSLPWFMWIVGASGLGVWCGACFGCLLLVSFRLFELLNVSRRFEAHTNRILCIATCYGLYFALFTPAPLANANHMSFFFDPFIDDVPMKQFVNWPHTFNNLLLVLSTVTLYALLCVVVVYQQKAMPSEGRKAMVSVNTSLFIQASLICVFNLTASLEYIYMNFFAAPRVFILIGQISFQIAHGEYNLINLVTTHI